MYRISARLVLEQYPSNVCLFSICMLLTYMFWATCLKINQEVRYTIHYYGLWGPFI